VEKGDSGEPQIKGSFSRRGFLALFEKYGRKREALKLKTAVMLQEVLDITRSLLVQYHDDPTYVGDPVDVETQRDEKIEKLMQVRGSEGARGRGVERDGG
jgi:hypothetical protein